MSLVLHHDFVTDKSLSGRKGGAWPYNRGGNDASYFDSAGDMQIVALNVPRFDHLPVSPFTSLGLKFEGTRINRHQDTEDFSAFNVEGCTIDADANASPLSGSSMERINVTAGAGRHSIWGGTYGITNGGIEVHSAFFKDDGAGFCFLGVGISSEFITVVMDFSDGTITQQTAGGTSAILAAGSEQLKNGIWRLWVCGTIAGTGATVFMGPAETGTPTISFGRASYTATAGSDVFAWGAQIELSNTALLHPSSYIPNATAGTLSRTEDLATYASLAAIWNNLGIAVYVRARSQYNSANGSNNYFYISDGTSGDRILQRGNTSANTAHMQAYNTGAGGSAILTATGEDFVENADRSLAVSIKLNNCEFYTDGVRAATGDTSCDCPQNCTEFDIGHTNVNTDNIFGWIQEVRLYNEWFDQTATNELSQNIFPVEPAEGSSGMGLTFGEMGMR